MIAIFLLGACSSAATQAPAAQESKPEAPATEATPEAPAAEAKETLTMVMPNTPDQPGNAAIAKIAEHFTAANPNIEISFEYIPMLDLPAKVETSFLANNEADIIVFNYMGPSLDWISSGLAVPLNEELKAWNLEDRFIERALNTWKEPDGKQAGIPLPGFDWPVWYNMDILKQAGVETIPTTQAELIETAQKVRAAGFQPFSIGGNMGALTQLYQTAINQAFILDDQALHYREGNYGSSEAAIAVTQSFINLWEEGVFCDGCEGMDWGAMESMYFEGRAAMGFNGMWAYAAAPEEIQEVTVLGGFPVLEGAIADKPSAIMGAYVNQGIFVTRNGAKKMDAVSKFLIFLHTKEEYQAYVDAQATLSPLKDVTAQASETSPLYAQSLGLVDKVWTVNAGETLIPGPVWNEWDKVAVAAMDPASTGESVIKMLDDIYINALK